MNVSEYLFRQLAENGVRDVFTISGGGIMYLCEALGRTEGLRYWCNYNEQATTIAAESYSKVSENVGVCLVTTGPGSTNALSGVAGAWVDSIPLLIISGQVRTAITADYTYQRQVGPQEINILPMAEPVTKYAVTLTNPQDVRYELEKCLFMATSSRPGPVWLNIPLDVQSAQVEPGVLRPFIPDTPNKPTLTQSDVERAAEMLRRAKRPVIIGGNGVVLAGARQDFRDLVDKLGVPALLSISGMDLLPESSPLLMGRFGPGGQRRANFVLQNADLILAIGTSLSISCIGFSQDFARKAKKVLVNIDPGDLKKENIQIDLSVLADAKHFIKGLTVLFNDNSYTPPAAWAEICATWKENYPTRIPDNLLQRDCVDLFIFYEELSRHMEEDDIFVLGPTGDACYVGYQHHRVKSRQKMFTSVCYGAMGWDLPALTGASVAAGNRRSILVAGDGSMLFNVHELMFFGLHRLNSKIFIVNNDGYQSIRSTQDRFFEGHHVGTDSSSGVGNPDFGHLATAFHLKYLRIARNEDVSQAIETVFADNEPWLVEIQGSRVQQRFRIGSYRKPDGSLATRPLEDMEPLLSREELAYNMTLFDKVD